MKAYVIQVLIIDHDELGPSNVESVLRSTQYANRCIAPEVLGSVEYEIGDWDDSHPLNQRSTNVLEWLESNRVEVPSIRYDPFAEDLRYSVGASTYGTLPRAIRAIGSARFNLIVVDESGRPVQVRPNVNWEEAEEIADQVRSTIWRSVGATYGRTQCNFSDGNGWVCQNPMGHEGPHRKKADVK